MIYDKADEAIRAMNRHNLRAFNSLKLEWLDGIDAVRKVNKVYSECIRYAKHKYRDIARDAYMDALEMAHSPGGNYARRAYKAVDDDWILDMLEEVDPVMLYAFTPEVERKKQRLIEALTIAHDKNKEIDKALRYLTVQIGQFAITAVDKAIIEAFQEADVKKVKWNTKKDERVCDVCGPRDGKIYRIGKVPAKEHPNCRCWLTPVL